MQAMTSVLGDGDIDDLANYLSGFRRPSETKCVCLPKSNNKKCCGKDSRFTRHADVP
jgi:hypothetical protein